MSPYDDHAVSAGEIADYLHSLPSTTMSFTSPPTFPETQSALGLSNSKIAELQAAGVALRTKVAHHSRNGMEAYLAHLVDGDQQFTERLVLEVGDTLEALLDVLPSLVDRLQQAEARVAEYPTQWGYEQACAALEKHRQRADAAEARITELKERLQSALTAVPGVTLTWVNPSTTSNQAGYYTPLYSGSVASNTVTISQGATAAVCVQPPPGWVCTRGAGHTGPCAAHATNG